MAQLEPIAPTWDAQAGRYVHNWNPNYLNDLRSMITKARAAGIMVILDMQQDFWSPALHNITNWDGTPGYCEGYGMPRWMYPSIDVKPSTTQSTDFYNGMNWFFRNIHDPMATVTRVTPWELYGDVWKMVSYEFSAASGFPAYQTVVGADLFNEPWWSYVGGSPPAGQTVAQAAGRGCTPSTLGSLRRSQPTPRTGCCSSRTPGAATTPRIRVFASRHG